MTFVEREARQLSKRSANFFDIQQFLILQASKNLFEVKPEEWTVPRGR